MDGRIVGIGASTAVLVGLVLFALGFFTSMPGTFIAGFIASAVGISAGAAVEPRRALRTASVVLLYVGFLVIGYLAVTQYYVSRFSPPGSFGGPNVPPP